MATQSLVLDPNPMLLDETTLRKLDQLTLVASRVRAGHLKGDRRSTKRGASIEFADYRDYTPGDDLRRLDWNIYARLDRPFIKLLEEEEDLAVHLMIDASRSMDWGEGELHKFRYACRLAAALGAIALHGGDVLTLQMLRATPANPANLEVPSVGYTQVFGPLRGGKQVMRLFQLLNSAVETGASGPTNLNTTLGEVALATGRHGRRPGLGFILTDMFSPAGYEAGLKRLLSRGVELTLVHLLAPDELDPPLAGDLRLVDLETQDAQVDAGIEVSLDGGLRALYRRRVQTWQDEIQADCLRRGVHYLRVDTGISWDKVVLSEMRHARLVR